MNRQFPFSVFRIALHCGFSDIADIQCLIYVLTRARTLSRAMVKFMMADNDIFAKMFDIISIKPVALNISDTTKTIMQCANKRNREFAH